ncbi:LysR family transcriptional regulator [Azotosporobacter soli]|uniref:LysR family transcriptional regulator n=1 Tax=Azotosporobacter soli TaxID=3055040 RepID=UPI0031FE5ECC
MRASKIVGCVADMELRLLETFLMVAKMENITQAAEQLKFSQPTVTTQIRTLEEDFGVLLFERVGKKLYRTEAGTRLIGYAEKMLLLHGEAQAALQEFSYDRVIKIGLGTAVAAHTLSPVLQEFQTQLPNVAVQIEHCLDVPTAVKGVLDNCFDFAIVHKEIANKRIVKFDIVVEPLLWVARPDLLAKYGKDVWLHPFIALKQGSIYRGKYDGLLKENKKRPVLEYSDSEGIRQAALNGLGVGVLPEVLVKHDLREGALVAFEDAPLLTIDFSLIFHREKTFTLPIRTLLEVLARHGNRESGLLEYMRAH